MGYLKIKNDFKYLVNKDELFARCELHKQKGFSILEVILVVAVMGIIFAAMAPIFRSTMLSWEVRDRQMEVVQQGRVGMEEMIRTIKSAVSFTTIAATNIRFTDSDNTDVGYRFRNNRLQKRVGGSWQNLSEPINSLTFIYYDRNGTTTTVPGSVRSINVSMVVADSEGKVSPVTFSSTVMPRKDYASYKIVINEINYNPPGGGAGERRGEWVELFNYGATAIDLTSWQLSDARATDDLELGPGETTMTIPAGGYAIITANPTTVYTTYTVDASVIKLQVDDSKIGNILGNASDTVNILDSSGSVVDSVIYDDAWGGDGDGDTLERKTSGGGSSDPSNWEASSNILSYTAGSANTVL